MKATARPVTRMKAAAYPWQGPVSPVALSLFTGLTYTLVDALGRTVTPSTTPTIRINGGQEHGLALSESTRTNAVPHDCPTRSQLSHVAGDSPADAALTGAVLRVQEYGQTVTLSPNPRTNQAIWSDDPSKWYTRTGFSVDGQTLRETTATSPHFVRLLAPMVAGANTIAFRFRPVGRTRFAIQSDATGSWAYCRFDIPTLSAYSTPPGYSDAAIADCGDGTYIASVTVTCAVPGSFSAVLNALDATGAIYYTGDAAKGVDVLRLWVSAGASIGGPMFASGATPVTLTDYTLGTFAPDGSLPVTLAQPADVLSWDNAPAGCSLVQTDATHYTLTQPAVSDGNLIGYAALTFSGDLALGRSAWQDATVTSGQDYSFSAIVEVEGEPTYGPDGLFRVVLSGDTPSIGTATWTAIPGQTNRYRLDVTGLSVASSTGRVGIYRAPGQADARAFTISRWTLCDRLGRLIAGGASEADFTRDGALVTLTRALTGGVVEAVWT